MKRKHKRLSFVVLAMVLLGVAAALILTAFREHVVFFYSPSEMMEKHIAEGRRIRIGGLVEEGSVVRDKDALTVRFRVTDTAKTVPVIFTGILPDLFREGKGVVAQGKLGEDGTFRASEVLAKHDENYMPPEAAEALKKAGHTIDKGAFSGQKGRP